MLRRRAIVGSTAAGTAAAVAQCRAVTTRGQFNPIHDFSVSLGKYEDVPAGEKKSPAAAPQSLPFARNEKEFETIITNPGPIRVGYSPDYLNWMYLAYKNKVSYELAQRKAQTQQKQLGDAEDANAADMGRFLRPATSYRRRAGEAKKAANQAKISTLVREQGMYDLVERQPQFPFLDLASATRFHFVELFKDLVLHYYNANYFNMSNAAGGGDGSTQLNGNFSFAQEVWDKALLYRAILEERKNTYPEKTFKSIFEAVRDTNLVPLAAAAEAGTAAATAASPSSPSSGGAALSDRCPTEEQYLYFRYLVKKYFVENAVEGHVVLKAHRQPNAAELLFASPPPKDDNEVFASLLPGKSWDDQATTSKTDASVSGGGGGGGGATLSMEALKRLVRKKPGQYPPIEALWRCEENLPLLKILVFGELNLFVSENPFMKFPNALPFLTRPYATAASSSTDADGTSSSGAGGASRANAGGRGYNRQHRGDVLSLANVIAERRGTSLVGFPRNVAALIDGRHADIRRQQQRFHREDILAFSKVLTQHGSVTGSSSSSAAGGRVIAGPGRGAGATASPSPLTAGSAEGSSHDESDAFFYGAYADLAYYNPRTTRAETRDYLSRKSIAALKEVRAAEEDIYRDVGIEEAEMNQQFSRCMEGLTTLPVHLPTLPHYVAIIKKDPHVSFLLHTSVATQTSSAGNGEGGAHALQQQRPQRVRELERLIFQLARALTATAMHYHTQAVRRVNRQKVNVAAALLDSFVEREVARAKQVIAQSTAASAGVGGPVAEAADDQMRLVNSLGTYKPFEGRALDESGYFTDARMDDYKRWMAAPR